MQKSSTVHSDSDSLLYVHLITPQNVPMLEEQSIVPNAHGVMILNFGMASVMFGNF